MTKRYTTLKELASLTLSGSTSGVVACDDYDVSDYAEGLLFPYISALTGVGTIVFTYELSPDGTNFAAPASNTIGTIASVSYGAPLAITNFGQYIRVKYNATGAFTAMTAGVKFMVKD
jgi:hypothetical protein